MVVRSCLQYSVIIHNTSRQWRKRTANYNCVCIFYCKLNCNMFRLFNPLNAELNPICHLLALLGAHHILHVSRIRVKGHHQAL